MKSRSDFGSPPCGVLTVDAKCTALSSRRKETNYLKTKFSDLGPENMELGYLRYHVLS